MALDRRTFLRNGASVAALPWLAACASPFAADAVGAAFQHGVASGDPGHDRVILWTRVSAASGQEPWVQWEIARDAGFSERVAGGSVRARAARDHTVKLDVGGLAPGTTYYYRFATPGSLSPVGRTRTLPLGSPERMRLAFCSCAALEWGYFASYRHIAARSDLDAVLHLGDYIYEGPAEPHSPGHGVGRAHRPDRELVSLDDYRERYAQYRTDPDLQELHRQHPVISGWDDHEFADNAWSGGAANHQPGEGEWAARRQAAEQAYREWLPIREWDSASGPYRSFAFGDLADLMMLETRLGRDEPVLDRTNRAGLESEERSLLGAAQEQWLADRFVESQRRGAAWRVIGQQVVFSTLRDHRGFVHNVDAWDGYSATRDRVFDLWRRRGLRDNVILTGDVHSSWALDAVRDPYASGGYDRAPGGDVWATEFVTPGVSARSGVPADRLEAATAAALRDNPHLQWIDLAHQGYAVLDLDEERAQCDWYFVSDVEQRDAAERLAARFRVQRGGSGMIRVEPEAGA